MAVSAPEPNQHVTFFSFMGIVASVIFSNLGAGYGTAKTGVGICSMGVLKPNLIFKSLVPVVMSGVLGIYGLIVGFMINGKINEAPVTGLSFQASYKLLAAGLCCGLSAMAAGMTIGIVGDAGVRAFGQQDKIFGGMLLILIFAEAVALYGLIIALVMIFSGKEQPAKQ